jgi:hypothetical protein
MSESEKRELASLLEYRTLSDFQRRKRRLLAIPLSVVPEALERARKGLPLTTEQYIERISAVFRRVKANKHSQKLPNPIAGFWGFCTRGL